LGRLFRFGNGALYLGASGDTASAISLTPSVGALTLVGGSLGVGITNPNRSIETTGLSSRKSQADDSIIDLYWNGNYGTIRTTYAATGGAHSFAIETIGGVGYVQDTSKKHWFLTLGLPTDSNREGLSLTLAAGSATFAAETNGTGTDNIDIIATPAGTGGFTYPTKTITVSGSGSDAASALQNSFIRITSAGTRTLPAAVPGLAATYRSTTAAVFSLDPASTSDYIILNGNTLAGGNKITSDGTIGATVTLVCEIVNYWVAYPNLGVFSDGGA
jgi:hypothetical protein